MQQETPQVEPTPIPPVPSLPTPQPIQASGPQQAQGPFYNPEESQDHPTTLTWDASEYTHTEKGAGWLIVFLSIVVVAVALTIFFGIWTFTILILVMALAMGIFAFRPPHVLHYVLDDEGVEIAGKLHAYEDFRAFGILEDGAFYTMTLIPAKRFSPALSVYFAEADGEQIVDIVGQYLPMEHVEPDFIDYVMRRLHF